MAKSYTNSEIAKKYLQKYGAGWNFHSARLEATSIERCKTPLHMIYIKNPNLNGTSISRTWGRLQTRQLEELLRELTR